MPFGHRHRNQASCLSTNSDQTVKRSFFRSINSFFFNFSCMFLNFNIFCPIWILFNWTKNIRSEKPPRTTKNCSDLSLFEKIVPVIEKNFWNSRLKAKNFQKFFSITRTFFFLTVDQNNFDNKITSLSFADAAHSSFHFMHFSQAKALATLFLWNWFANKVTR